MLEVETNAVSGRVDLTELPGHPVAFDGGGLGRRLSVYRVPEGDWSRRVVCEHGGRSGAVMVLMLPCPRICGTSEMALP